MPSALSSSIQEAFLLVQEPLEAVKASLLDIVPPDSVVLAQTVHQSLTSGGKYMRPAITILSGNATGNPEAAQLVEVAAVTETIHIATLLHDDVLDESLLRRGQKTVRADLGNKISVLSGDYLLAQASIKLSKLGIPRLVSIFAHVLADLCDGEVEQMQTSHTLTTSWESYYKKTMGKTASLFSAGCESAGVLNQLPEEQIQALKTYGRSFGIAFQIVDDMLDYTATEAELGKPVLDDLRNGLLNAPMLLALESERLSKAGHVTLREAIQQAFQDPTNEVIARIQDLLEQSQALEATRRLAEQHVHTAQDALDFAPSTPAKQALLDVVAYVIERKH